MRAFNKNRNYLSETPNITWDDSFVPPELYGELASSDGKGSQGMQAKKRERDKASERMEEQMSKEKAKATQNDKRKTNLKETAQDKDDTENTQRKWKSSESSLVFDIADDSEEGTSADEDEPSRKRFKRKNSIDDVGTIPPCRQCTSLKKECIPNGWSVACKNCRKVRRTCSLSKALRNGKGKAKETAEDNEEPDDTEKPQSQRPREINASIHALTKSILDNGSIEDEDDVEQLDGEVPAKASPQKMKVLATTNDGFITYDPKVYL